jgi:hypothetical protein
MSQTPENLWAEWQAFMIENRNAHPIRGISFEQFVIIQLAKLQPKPEPKKPEPKKPEPEPKKKEGK